MSDGGGDALAQQQQQQQQQLIQLLTACVSPDEQTRKDAEMMVQSSGAVFGFGDLLCRTAFGLMMLLMDIIISTFQWIFDNSRRFIKEIRQRAMASRGTFFYRRRADDFGGREASDCGKICAGLSMKDSK